jgi:hypothetical protein
VRRDAAPAIAAAALRTMADELLIKMGITSPLVHKLPMRPALHDPPLVNHQDAIRPQNGR